jgi:hypothetical protein
MGSRRSRIRWKWLVLDAMAQLEHWLTYCHHARTHQGLGNVPITGVAKELETIIRQRVAALGLEVISVGIRDVILPGDMKELMNKVTVPRWNSSATMHTGS